MRVLFLLDCFPVASETFIYCQILGIFELGLDVTVLAIKKGNVDIEQNVSKEIMSRVHYLEMPQNKLLRLLGVVIILLLNILRSKKLFRLTKSLNFYRHRFQAFSLRLFYLTNQIIKLGNNYDIIHAHFGPIGKYAVALSKIGIRGKSVVSFHGSDFSSYIKKKHCGIYNDVFEKSTIVTANSNYTKNKLVLLGCSKNKIIIIPESLVITKFKYRPRTLSSGEKVKILTVARLVEKKGLEYSIHAVDSVLKTYKNLEYNIIGDGPLREKLEGLILDLEIQDYIYLRGGLNWPGINQAYDSSHIFILSSVTAENGDEEGQGLVLQEAQASGLPVLATYHNGLPEGVIEGKTAFLVPERNIDALVQKLLFLIENADKWTQIGECGRKFVESKYDYTLVSAALANNYKKLIKE